MRPLLPVAPALHFGDLALALLYGLLTALAFALWPLGRAHDVTVSALFRDEVAPERRRPRMPYVIATVAVGIMGRIITMAIIIITTTDIIIIATRTAQAPITTAATTTVAIAATRISSGC